MELEPKDSYDITDFAARMNEAAEYALETGDLEGFDWYGDSMITLLEKFPQQRFAILEVLSVSENELVRAEACWALDSAYPTDPDGAIAIWRRLLNDPLPRVAGAAVQAYSFATQPEGPGETKTLKRRHSRKLKPLVRATISRLQHLED